LFCKYAKLPFSARGECADNKPVLRLVRGPRSDATLSAWYVGLVPIPLVVVALMAIYGFRTSFGGPAAVFRFRGE